MPSNASDRKARVEIGAKLPTPDALLEHILKNPFEIARPFSDPPPAFGW